METYQNVNGNSGIAGYKIGDTCIEVEFADTESVYRYSYESAGLKNVEEIIENLRPHIRDISFRTYYRKRREAIDALSSVLWGYTSKDSLDVLEQFFPEPKATEKKAGK